MNRIIRFTKRDDFVSLAITTTMLLVLSITSPIFWSASNIDSLAYAVSRNAIVAFGMMLVLICGYFDLSVGNIMLLTSLLSATLLHLGCSTPLAIAGGLVCGALCGALNGFLVAVVGVNALIATVGTQYMFYGIAMSIYEYAKKIKQLPEAFTSIANTKVWGMEPYIWCMLILLVAFSVYLRYSRLGRQLYCIGGNQEAANQMGYPIRGHVFACYTILGILSAIAGLFAMARIKNPSQNIGTDMHMTCIIACIVGGGSFAGGKGRISGALFGILFISLLSNMFNLWEVKSMFQNMTLGFVLIAVLTLDGWMNISRLRSLGKI